SWLGDVFMRQPLPPACSLHEHDSKNRVTSATTNPSPTTNPATNTTTNPKPATPPQTQPEPEPTSTTDYFYINADNKRLGPISETAFLRAVATREITDRTLVFRSGDIHWNKFVSVRGLWFGTGRQDAPQKSIFASKVSIASVFSDSWAATFRGANFPLLLLGGAFWLAICGALTQSGSIILSIVASFLLCTATPVATLAFARRCDNDSSAKFFDFLRLKTLLRPLFLLRALIIFVVNYVLTLLLSMIALLPLVSYLIFSEGFFSSATNATNTLLPAEGEADYNFSVHYQSFCDSFSPLVEAQGTGIVVAYAISGVICLLATIILLRLSFAIYFLADARKCGAFRSLGLSWRLTRGKTFTVFFTFVLSVLIIAAITAISLGGALIFVLPFFLVVPAVLYVKLYKRAVESTPADFPPSDFFSGNKAAAKAPAPKLPKLPKPPAAQQKQ
ncbi:MAG: hypothetical protein LUD52_02130, partial [Opitutae bacterium]|nr:hypothetical protein [Opitutae bacterium]